MLGSKYGVNGLGRQLPQDVVMDLAKSEAFFTDMNSILGSEDSDLQVPSSNEVDADGNPVMIKRKCSSVKYNCV
jgi:hypothetical protein